MLVRGFTFWKYKTGIVQSRQSITDPDQNLRMQWKSVSLLFRYCKSMLSVVILSVSRYLIYPNDPKFWTDRSGQTVQTQIRLLL